MKKILVLIAALTLLVAGCSFEKQDSDVTVKVTYYDSDGNILAVDRAEVKNNNGLMSIGDFPRTTTVLPGEVPYGAASAKYILTVKNTGDVPLDISILEAELIAERES